MAKKQPVKAVPPTSTAKAKRAKPAKKTKTVEPEPVKRIVEGDLALGKVYDVSDRTVQTWRSKGLPHEKKQHGYRFDLDLTDPWVQVFRKDRDSSDGNTQLRIELDEVKLRIEMAKAIKLEREEEEARGNILRRDEWESFAVELIQVCRGLFLQLGKQTRRHCCLKCAKTVPVELDKLVGKILQKLARMREGPREE